MPFEESMSCKKLLRMNSVSIMRKSWVIYLLLLREEAVGGIMLGW